MVAENVDYKREVQRKLQSESKVVSIYPLLTAQRQMLPAGRSTPDKLLVFRWISSNACLLNLVLVRSHQAEIIIVKRLIQKRNTVTRARARLELRLCDQGRRKNDAFILS